MDKSNRDRLVSLEIDNPIWNRVFTVAPLILVGSREQSGEYDLAPKHMAIQMGWQDYFGFICTPSHATYQNIKREEIFTVSFPRPSQVILASLSASPRCEENQKPALQALPTFSAPNLDGVFVSNSHLYLECRLNRIIDGFGPNSLIVGRIVGAHAPESDLRRPDRDEGEMVHHSPLLVYLQPGRYASVRRSFSFPFPRKFRR